MQTHLTAVGHASALLSCACFSCVSHEDLTACDSFHTGHTIESDSTFSPVRFRLKNKYEALPITQYVVHFINTDSVVAIMLFILKM